MDMTDITTIREMLDELHFDWESGVVYCHDWDESWDDSSPVRRAADGDLDREFDADFGGEEAPPFVAYDLNSVYFKARYDGSESCWKLPLDRNFWEHSPTTRIPVPGGG